MLDALDTFSDEATSDVELPTALLTMLRGALLIRREIVQFRLSSPDLDGGPHGVDGAQDAPASIRAEWAAHELSEINAALQRMCHGTYGSCERCGRRIAMEELEAKPHGRTCKRCPQGSRRR